ncbi:nucleoside triphosphate pyrophosphohydrolase family protein [Nostoc sp. XA010]|uniref:nucleoside triphosphate pyrophosphohydrolase family protein n=1 Tax=Nostoc sp. XA010 TaxID=2780407 RepID=UPI001E5142F9|nr:nucleoside triphosphate pyrophosphohydrolase family protein [Nostoc sp. XA010]MCC5662083.1 nucleoside triphosphate pyrophosphohydrolase family protein [Nostoc sp. XA010]
MSYPKICQITPGEYQDEIIKISKHYSIFGTEKALPTYSSGLSEEVGEVMGIIKWYFRGDEKPENFKENLTKELGDVTAYLVLIAKEFDINFEDILTMNIEKLQNINKNNTLLGGGSDMLEENKKTTKAMAIAANKTDDKHDQVVNKTKNKNSDKYIDIAPESKDKLKPIIKQDSQIYRIVTLLMKGSTLDEFENEGINIGTGRKGSRSFFGNYLKEKWGYGIKRTVDPSDPTNINKYVFHLQLPEGVDQPMFITREKSKKKV